MSDEPEARMWDEDRGSGFERSSGVYYESAFASSEHLDRAPLLSEDNYTEVAVSTDEQDDHCHWKSNNEPPSAVPQLVTALVLCGIFMVCELFGGYLAGSLSVMSDAVHMLSDCGGLALALLAFRCAKRPPQAHMSYGYKRAEVLGAMVSVLLIWVLTGIFVYLGAMRLRSGDYIIEPNFMIVVSACGVAFNLLLAAVLNGCAKPCGAIAHHHTHGGAACSHGHSHSRSRHGRNKLNGTPINGDYSMRDIGIDEAHVPSTNNDRNINLRAALIHVIGDLIQSCGVLLASIVIKLYPEAKFVDPICTFVFSILVLATSYRVVKDAIGMLMQGVPTHFEYRECVEALSNIRGVRHIHSMHVWALSTHHVILTAHVAIEDLSDPEHILGECQKIAREFNVQSATFQIETYNQRMARCVECCSQPALRA